MNGTERSASPSGMATSPPAPGAPTAMPAGAGGWRTSSEAGISTAATRRPIVICAPRQSCEFSSQLANGDMVSGATPTPIVVSDIASARWRSNQLLTTDMKGGKKLPAAKPTSTP